MEVSPFMRLELELLEAEHEAAGEMFDVVATAARGRAETVENPDGSTGTKWITLPHWTAAAWILERTFGFVKATNAGPAEGEDVASGYEQLRRDLDAASGDPP